MRCAGALLVVGAIVLAPAVVSAKQPPPADEAAQVVCQTMRLFDVNEEFGMTPTQSQFGMLLNVLRESRSEGAKQLAKRLFKAPTAAAQESVRSAVRTWCFSTLQLRCSAVECVDGNLVDKIPAKQRR